MICKFITYNYKVHHLLLALIENAKWGHGVVGVVGVGGQLVRVVVVVVVAAGGVVVVVVAVAVAGELLSSSFVFWSSLFDPPKNDTPIPKIRQHTNTTGLAHPFSIC